MILAAPAASNAFGIGASAATIIALIGIPLYRALRRAQTERAALGAKIDAMHGALFGSAEKRIDGVVERPAEAGIRQQLVRIEERLDTRAEQHDRLERTLDSNHKANTERIERLETSSSELTSKVNGLQVVAGQAAAVAAATKDRVEFLAGRWWERVDVIDQRGRMLTATLTEAGYDVGPDPDPPPPDEEGGAT